MKAIVAGVVCSSFALLVAVAGCSPSSGSNGGTGGSGSPGTGGGAVAGTGGSSSPGTGGSVAGTGGSAVSGTGGGAVAGTGGSASPGTGGSGNPGTGGSGNPGTGGAAAPCVSNPADYQYPFRDPCRPLEERVTNLLSLLTPEEKISLLHENQLAIPRLGIPFFTMFTEGLHGLGWADDPTRTDGTVQHMTATQFPQAFGLGHTWDPEVMRIVGDTTGREARVYNARNTAVSVAVRAPVLDLARDPRWGRTEESLGEDPYHVSELGKGMVRGLQGNDPKYLLTASQLKHFIGYNNETNRSTSSSNIDDRNLREYYSVPFYEAVKAGAQGMMTAYNSVNNVPSALTPLLGTLVRGDWGFDGMLCIDAWAAPNIVAAGYMSWPLERMTAEIVKRGSLLVGPETDREALKRAYAPMALVTAADMDGALRGSLRLRFRVGDFDPPARVPWKQQLLATDSPWTGAEFKGRALDVARKSVVLLKNANNTLPLARTGLTSIALIGPRADSVVRDWYGGTAPYKITPRQGIATKLGAGVMVRTAALTTTTVGGNTTNTLPADAMAAAVTAAQMSDVAVVFVGNHPVCGAGEDVWGICASPYEGREAFDRRNIGLEPTHLQLVQAVQAANPRTIVVLVSGTTHAVPWLQQNVPAILHIANSGQDLGTAVADVLFGDYNPGGRTAATWYSSETDIPTTIMDYDIRKGTTYLYYTGTPVFPFGHGLSYTSFTYANFALSAATVAQSGMINVSVDVTNSGTRSGDEVVQLYVAYPASTTLPRPRQQLRGFQRINLAAGATQRVTFPLRGEQLTYWNTAMNRFMVQPGQIQVQVGSSSKDIRHMGNLTVTQ